MSSSCRRIYILCSFSSQHELDEVTAEHRGHSFIGTRYMYDGLRDGGGNLTHYGVTMGIGQGTGGTSWAGQEHKERAIMTADLAPYGRKSRVAVDFVPDFLQKSHRDFMSGLMTCGNVP